MTALLRGLLKRHEGLRLKPYRCTSGKLTIGYGRNLEDVGISVEEAEYMLDNDMGGVIRECKTRFPWFEGLTDARQAVVASMVFNLGIAGFEAFKKTIWYIQERDYDMAAKEMLDSQWSRQVGYRAGELAEMMRRGK